jgi:hypothetical protein
VTTTAVGYVVANYFFLTHIARIMQIALNVAESYGVHKITAFSISEFVLIWEIKSSL